jgi:tRNA pseudouridine55 synthase
VTEFNSIYQFQTDEGGVLLLDKPRDWTSFDVVKKVRGMLRVSKVGHAGTLDPLATGLLILCSGRSTKSIDMFQALDKQYTGDMFLGAVTPSYDADTKPEQHADFSHVTQEALEEAAKEFLGDIEQVPPMYSALKVEGRRLYELARKGKEVERKSREVTISDFTVELVNPPRVRFSVTCSKGTYVRSLVHDLGQKLGCGAYVQSLRRTAIGSFSVDEAWAINDLQNAVDDIREEKEESDAGHPLL